MTTNTASVLIIDDEPDLADLYASWLEEQCHVETASGGTEAVEAIERGFDVLLLDRETFECLEERVFDVIRDRALECRVVLVTTVEPDLDIGETPFDDSLRKPLSKDKVRKLIEQLLLRRTYDDQLQEFFAIASRKGLLDGQKSDAEIQSSHEYAELEDRLAVLRVQVNEIRGELLEQGEYRRLYQEITGSPSSK